jgi:uncharacterized repeat protein (TIGR03806 family)
MAGRPVDSVARLLAAFAVVAALALVGCSSGGGGGGGGSDDGGGNSGGGGGGGGGSQPYGLTQLVPLQAHSIPVQVGTPGVARAYSNLSFSSPLQLLAPQDGTDRVFVVEQGGRVKVFPNRDNVQPGDVTTYLDLRGTGLLVTGGERGLLGVAFDPDYDQNRWVYVYHSSPSSAQGSNHRSILARYQTLANDPNRADTSSRVEVLTVEQPFENHNGGMIVFGPDGHLYLGLGDGGGAGDPRGNAQDTSTLLGSILRITPTAAGGYTTPATNPLVGQTGRDEIYAWGLRNPWRFSFDRSTGDLWLGDVGHGAREEVDIVELGDNLGWNVFEGDLSYDNPRGLPASSFKQPVRAYNRNTGTSVVGGYAYRGTLAPSLTGAYIYGDFGGGRIWALRRDAGGNVVSNDEIARVSAVSSFGEDEAGEVYAVSFGGSIWRLRDTGGGATTPPQLLSQTGLFTDTQNLVPQAGLIPYDLNAPFWSDGAAKTRWVGLPRGGEITFRSDAPWDFPAGTILVKHFELELTVGVPSSAKRLETRVLARTANGWEGWTWQWNQAGTDATLLAGAATETYTITDPLAPGGTRQQTYDYPSRADCLVCHNQTAGFALGVGTLQLNRDFSYAGATDNQLRAWNHVGVFHRDIGDAAQYDAHEAPSDASAPLEGRSRAWLDTNCAACHQPNTGIVGGMDLRATTALGQTGLVDVAPTRGDLGLTGARRIAPGDRSRSVLWERIRIRGTNQMPPLATHEVDDEAVDLIGDWIDGL